MRPICCHIRAKFLVVILIPHKPERSKISIQSLDICTKQYLSAELFVGELFPHKPNDSKTNSQNTMIYRPHFVVM